MSETTNTDLQTADLRTADLQTADLQKDASCTEDAFCCVIASS